MPRHTFAFERGAFIYGRRLQNVAESVSAELLQIVACVGLACRVPGLVADCGERCGTVETIYENSLIKCNPRQPGAR